PNAALPGVGVRQSSGAFESGLRAQKRQRTAAVQDASAPAAASSRFLVPMHAQKRTEAHPEPRRNSARFTCLAERGGEGSRGFEPTVGGRTNACRRGATVE